MLHIKPSSYPKYSVCCSSHAPFLVVKLCFLFVFVSEQGHVMPHEQLERMRLLTHLLCTTHRHVCALACSVCTITLDPQQINNLFFQMPLVCEWY